MMLRYIAIEFIEFFSKPLYWAGLIVASMLVLGGLDQLALDRSLVKVLIVDNEPEQKQGLRIKSLVRELSGTEAIVKGASGNLEDLIDVEKADIVLSRLSNRWQASLRPRSILDHRRLARIGFTIAAVVNRLSPWETIISADSVAPSDYGKTACDVGARMCSVYREIGDPRFADLCGTSSEYSADGDYEFDGKEASACPSSGKFVLKEAIGLDYQLRKFCQPDLVDADRTRGICRPSNAPRLGSVVSILSEPQSHTRVFVPRTICLLAVFVAFVVACRSLLNETRNNTLPVVASISQGRLGSLLAAKVILTVAFSVLLVLILLELSKIQFGISVKPGLWLMLIPIAIGALSSAMLGLSIGLVVKNEVAAYAIGSIYLLILFILSGYIDDLKETDSLFSIFSYILPLKYMIAPFSSWMVLGAPVPFSELVSPNLISQCLGSFVLLLIANEYYHRTL
jgi:hypothetical protein